MMQIVMTVIIAFLEKTITKGLPIHGYLGYTLVLHSDQEPILASTEMALNQLQKALR